MFYAADLSLSLHIAKLAMDGDCGLDVMCLMLAWKRCKHNLGFLRSEMAAFALQHVGNRAPFAMMHSVGELTTHLGLSGLGSVGAKLPVGASV